MIDGASVPCANMVDSSHVQIITIQVSGYLLAASVFSSPSIHWFSIPLGLPFPHSSYYSHPLLPSLHLPYFSYFYLVPFLGKLLKRKWEDAMSIDKKSWGYRRNIEFTDIYNMEELTEILASTVRWWHLEFVKHIILLPRGQGGQLPPSQKITMKNIWNPIMYLNVWGFSGTESYDYLWKIFTWIR